MKAHVFITLTVLLGLTGCITHIDLEAEYQTMIKADRDWSAAASSKNMETLWPFWTDDALILLTPEKTLRGIEQIKAFTVASRKDPNFEISWEIEGGEVSPSGEFGYTYGVGRVTRTGEDGKPFTSVNPYLIVWEKQPDGRWKCVVEK
jgi:ketosteroid isomerase-like protein